MKNLIPLTELYQKVQLSPPTFSKNKVKLNIKVIKRNGNRGYIHQTDFDKLLQKY